MEEAIGDLLACFDRAKRWSSKVHLLPGCFWVVEGSETVGIDLVVFACESLTSVQEFDEWVCLKPQEIVIGVEIVHVHVGEITLVEKLLLENTRFPDNITPSTIDALAYQ